MLSMPAQTKTSPAPSAIWPAAMWIDCMDEPQNRLTVTPATESGRSASRPIRRATLSPCSASGKAQPTMMSSISSGFTPVRVINARTTCAARSSGRTLRQAAFAGEMERRAGIAGDDGVGHGCLPDWPKAVANRFMQRIYPMVSC